MWECCYQQIWIIKIEVRLFLMKSKEHIQHTNLIMELLNHIGRNKKRIFDANVYFWNGIIWENIKIHTDFKKSKNLFSDGSGKKEYDENFLRFKNGNNESTSRNYFHCFCDIVKNVKDKHTGGIPQLVGLYNGSKFNGMYQECPI